MPNKELETPFDQPQPIKFAPAPGTSSYTNDETTRLLVDKYGVPADQAAVQAHRFRQGDPDEGLQAEAMQQLADRERRRLMLMKKYIAAKESPVSPEDSEWVAQVDAKHRQLVQQRAAQTYTTQRGIQDTQVARQQELRQPAVAQGQGQLMKEAETAQALLKMGLDVHSATQLALQMHGHKE